MRVGNVLSVVMAVFLAFGFSLTGIAQDVEGETSAQTEEMKQVSEPAVDKKTEEEKSRAEKASEVLTKQMEQPEGKRISSDTETDRSIDHTPKYRSCGNSKKF